eukprot:CFRG5028T1
MTHRARQAGIVFVDWAPRKKTKTFTSSNSEHKHEHFGVVNLEIVSQKDITTNLVQQTECSSCHSSSELQCTTQSLLQNSNFMNITNTMGALPLLNTQRPMTDYQQIPVLSSSSVPGFLSLAVPGMNTNTLQYQPSSLQNIPPLPYCSDQALFVPSYVYNPEHNASKLQDVSHDPSKSDDIQQSDFKRSITRLDDLASSLTSDFTFDRLSTIDGVDESSISTREEVSVWSSLADALTPLTQLNSLECLSCDFEFNMGQRLGTYNDGGNISTRTSSFTSMSSNSMFSSSECACDASDVDVDATSLIDSMIPLEGMSNENKSEPVSQNATPAFTDEVSHPVSRNATPVLTDEVNNVVQFLGSTRMTPATSPDCTATTLLDDVQKYVPLVYPGSSTEKHPGMVACANCCIFDEKTWRRNERGETLCNACGLYEKAKGTSRPRHLAHRKLKRLLNKVTTGKDLLDKEIKIVNNKKQCTTIRT